MGRSRSRSRSPKRRRSRSREKQRDNRRRREREDSREKRRERDRQRSRSRSRSRDRERERVELPGSSASKQGKNKPLNLVPAPNTPILTEKDFDGKSKEEIDMMKIMGFGSFDTSKNKKVKGNAAGDIHVNVKRRYRQYMNRKGGFNRPLDAV